MKLLAANLRPRDIVHLEGARECRDRRRRNRRLDQRRAASARDGERGRHQVRSLRRRRHLQAHALSRLAQARRRIRRQGHVGSGRRADAAEDAARRRLHPRRLHDGHRQDHRGEYPRREVQSESEGHAPGQRAARADRRRGRAQRQPRARRRHRESRGPEASSTSRTRRASSTAKRMPSPPSRRATTRPATSSSSATKDPRAVPACARCCRRPRRSTGRAWRQRRADHRRPVLGRHARASASAMSGRKPPMADRSASCAKATSSSSTP